MLDFVVHLTKNMSRAAGTVKNYVSAISTKQEMLGLERPSEKMRRVKLALMGPSQAAGSRKPRASGYTGDVAVD